MLYLRTTPSHSQEEILVFVVPTHKRRATIDGCHHFAGYQRRDRTVSLIKEQFWWPSMIQETMMSVRNYTWCVQFEAWVQKPKMEPIFCTEPMDLVHIDYVKWKSPYVWRRSQSWKTFLWLRIITPISPKITPPFLVFGFPHWLMSDQAPDFFGKVIAAMCDLLGVSKVSTSPYNPQSHGAVEHAHQTLRRMISKTDPERHRKWLSHLRSVIIAYNATRSLVMGF